MDHNIIDGPLASSASFQEAAPDILIMNFEAVNACLVGKPGKNTGDWALVDTGLENSADFIIQTAEHRFGAESRPRSIILTHGHFDQIGTARKLADFWDVSTYIHQLEMPAASNGFFRLTALPDDGHVPGMPSWKWIHNPSNNEGHISLFREKDRALIAGGGQNIYFLT